MPYRSLAFLLGDIKTGMKEDLTGNEGEVGREDISGQGQENGKMCHRK